MIPVSATLLRLSGLAGVDPNAAMWRAIPMLRPLGLVARNRFVLAGLEKLYGRFLKVRPRLQRALGATTVPGRSTK